MLSFSEAFAFLRSGHAIAHGGMALGPLGSSERLEIHPSDWSPPAGWQAVEWVADSAALLRTDWRVIR